MFAAMMSGMRWRKTKPGKHPMNVTLAGIEELDLFPTPEAREQAIAEHAEAVRGWDLVLGIAICVVAASGAWAFARWGNLGGLSYIMPLPNWAREIITFATVVVCMFITLRYLHRWGVKRELRRKLIDLRVPVCEGCGYLLRGVSPSTERCPECGRAIDARVRDLITPPEPSQSASDEGNPSAPGA